MELNTDKVMISQDQLEMMRFDASRSERSTTAAVVSTAVMVGAAVAVGYVVYSDVKDGRDHRARMEKMHDEHDDLKRRIAELTKKKDA